jgi:hypothetical protein
MVSGECRERLLALLSNIDGIRSVTPKPGEMGLELRFDSRTTARMNIEHAILSAGFDVDGNQGAPEAKQSLPETCR